MLHRMALRVLPQLTLAVTADDVRRRKRWVMGIGGFAAFVCYRVVKRLDPLTSPLVLLAVSAAICAIGAAVAYQAGRQEPWGDIRRTDGARRLAWLVGWIGVVYGVQLSLLVLALLSVVAQYDFLRHPDGPGMMAVIIACTSVVRDAFEIGHLRRLQSKGEPIFTFPDGVSLWRMLQERTIRFGQRVGLPALVCAVPATVVAGTSGVGSAPLFQLLVVSTVAGTLCLWAYLGGEQAATSWRRTRVSAGLPELFRFWWWPGVAFAATYYLVLAGFVRFVFRASGFPLAVHGLIAAAVAGIMALYGYYLGSRRRLEVQATTTVPASVLRCPFVLGILSKSSPASGKRLAAPAGLAVDHMVGRHQ